MATVTGPGDGQDDASDDPVDPRAVRVQVPRDLALPDPGPWTIAPGTPGDDEAHALVGEISPPNRDGTRRLELVVDGWRLLLDVGSERAARLRARARRGREDALHGGPLDVRAIIPGRVVAVAVAEGDVVEVGQQLLVIEAMKMQNELRSPRAGRVERLAVGAGQTVDLGALLLVLE